MRVCWVAVAGNARKQCVAVCCSVLQCIAVCCRVSQCVAGCCRVLKCVAVCCNVLLVSFCQFPTLLNFGFITHDSNILQHTATQCNTRQHNATHYNTLTTQCSKLQHIVTHCNALQHIATTEAFFAHSRAQAHRGGTRISGCQDCHGMIAPDATQQPGAHVGKWASSPSCYAPHGHDQILWSMTIEIDTMIALTQSVEES